MVASILVADDEPDITSVVSWNLRREGYQTREVDNGADALLQATLEPTPDLIILDIMMPDLSGVEVCRRLRSQSSTAEIPILMLTAKDEEVDRVVGFEVGADDYMVKPFSMRELLLRVAAILRRTQPSGHRQPIDLGPIRVDREGHRVWIDGAETSLTSLEFRLLTTLLERRGRVQSREALLRDVWGVQSSITTRTVDTHIKRLREKLGSAAELIETVRGVGYRLTELTGAS